MVRHRRFQQVARLLRAARRPVRELDVAHRPELRQVIFGLRAHDGLLGRIDAASALAEHVERLHDVGERVDIARIGLARTKVLVLKLELRIRKRPCLLPHALRDADALGFGLERLTRRQRPVHRLAKAERLLCRWM